MVLVGVGLAIWNFLVIASYNVEKLQGRELFQ